MVAIDTHLIDKQCTLLTNDGGLNTVSGHSYATDHGTYLYSYFGVSYMKFNTTKEPVKYLWKHIWNYKHSILNIYNRYLPVTSACKILKCCIKFAQE